MPKPKLHIKDSLVDFFEALFIGSIVFLTINLFIGELLVITGDSMTPNFHDGEQIISEKLSLNFRPIERGDVIIFKHPHIPGRLVVKRAVGLPGETFEIIEGKVYINGTVLSEPYLNPHLFTVGSDLIPENLEITLKSDEYIMLGDNRKESEDSREWGPISEDSIDSKAFLVYFPIHNFRLIRN